MRPRHVLSLALLILTAIAGSSVAGASASPMRASAPGKKAPRAATALAAVGRLVVKGRGPMTGYSRAQFGPAWEDVDHNGCDTRDDILRRDLTTHALRPGTHGCVVVSGTYVDRYTGTTITYRRGVEETVDIDHMVALGDAWQMGAARWSEGKRVAFANDPLNLAAVSASANRQKGDADAASWLPPNRGARCWYVTHQLAVKLKYGLAATFAERDAIRRVLDGCPSDPMIALGSIRPVSIESTPATAHPPARGGARVFANCTAARAAGVTPIYRGTPLYDANRKLDRDGDGIACEE